MIDMKYSGEVLSNRVGSGAVQRMEKRKICEKEGACE
jgi:hypothetical protein